MRDKPNKIHYVLVISLFSCVFLVGCKDKVVDASDIAVKAGSRLKINCMNDSKSTLHDVEGIPILVLCRSSKDLNNLQMLDDEIFDSMLSKDLNYRAVRNEIFVVIPISPLSNCKVDFIPQNSNDFGWLSNDWLGGFHSVCDSEVYDMAGRQLKPGRYSPTKFPKFIGNLTVPDYKYISETEIEFN